MKNDLDKLILGFVIGGLISGCAFYLLKANEKQKKVFFTKMGKIIGEVSDLLKETSAEEKDAVLEELMKTVPKKGHIADLMKVAAIGINVWKKWR